MAKTVNFEFYKCEFELNNNLPSMELSFSDFLYKPPSLDKDVYQVGGYKGFLKKINENIFVFQKLKHDFNPKLLDLKTGNETEITLEEDEYVVEETFFYYDFDNNILIYHMNRSGFAPSAFEEYIKKLLNSHLKNNTFILKPILSKQGYEKLASQRIVKKIDLSVAQPSLGVLKELGFNVEQIVDMDIDSLSEIEIVFKSKRKHGILTIENFKKIFGNFASNPGIEKLKIHASPSYESRQNQFDLLDDRYIVPRTISTIKGKTLDRNAIIFALNELATEHISMVLKLIDNVE